MKIIHLTDMHLRESLQENWVMERIDKICSAFNSVIREGDFVILLISGDIAYSGKNRNMPLRTS